MDLEASRSVWQNSDASYYWRRCWSQSPQKPFSSACCWHPHSPQAAHWYCASLPAPSVVWQLIYLKFYGQNDTQISTVLTIRSTQVDEKQFSGFIWRRTVWPHESLPLPPLRPYLQLASEIEKESQNRVKKCGTRFISLVIRNKLPFRFLCTSKTLFHNTGKMHGIFNGER